MESLVKLIRFFEKRNNISISVTVYSDGSSHVEEFWNEERLNESKTPKGLYKFLTTVNYKLDPIDGRCYSPVQRIHDVAGRSEQFSCPLPDARCDRHKIDDDEGRWEFCNTCRREWAR